MLTLGCHSITVIFHIFIIQCLLLDGLLCYQYDGPSNPPSPRQHARDHDQGDIMRGPFRPSPRVWDQEKDENKFEQERGKPSFFIDDQKVQVKKNTQEDTLYSKHKNDVTVDHQPHRYRHHYHQAVASAVGQDKKKYHPHLFSTTAVYRNPNLRPYRRGTGADKKKRVQNSRRLYKTISESDINNYPSAPFVHKLSDKTENLQGVNRYEKASYIHSNNRPSYPNQPSPSTLPTPSYSHPPPPQHHEVPEEAWDKLLGKDNGMRPSQEPSRPSSSQGLSHQHSQKSYDPRRSYQPPSRGGSSFHMPSKRSSDPHSLSHEMYQADEPSSEQLEAYIAALHHMEEMNTCSAVRCKDPQPFVQYMHDPFNVNIRFLPQCTILHRCMNFTGCCGDMTRECVPKRTTVIRKAFLVMDISSGNGRIMTHDPTNAQMIELVNHTECECREKIKLVRCTKRCPVPLRLIREGFDCLCDCRSRTEEYEGACENVKHGVLQLSVHGLVCIKEDNCYKPQCIVGNFDVKTGLCPLSDRYALPGHMFDNHEDRRHYRKHLKGFGFTFTEVSIKVSVNSKKVPDKEQPKKVRERQPHGRHSDTRKKGQGGKTSSELHKAKPKQKSTTRFHSKLSASRKEKVKKKVTKPKNQLQNSKRGRRFRHGGTFSAQEFLEGKVPAYPLLPPNKHTSHGAPYNLKKHNLRTKPKTPNTKTDRPALPPPMAIRQRPQAPMLKKQPPTLTMTKTTKSTTKQTSTLPNSTPTSKVPFSKAVTKLSPVTAATQLPISSSSSEKKDTKARRIKSNLFSLQNKTTKAFSTSSSSQSLPSTSTSTPHYQMTALTKTSDRIHVPHSLSTNGSVTLAHNKHLSTQKTLTRTPFKTTYYTSTPPSSSTKSSQFNEKSANEILNTFNEADDQTDAAASLEYSLDSKRTREEFKDHDNVEEESEINSMEDEYTTSEGSGSDAEI